MEWRFAQIGDIRLGAKLSRFESDVASALRDGCRRALSDCFKVAQEHGSSAVLMPGDLYLIKGMDPAGQLRYIYECMADYPSMEFLIMPGNSDAFDDRGAYSYVKPPSNARLIFEPGWHTIELDKVTITAYPMQLSEGGAIVDWDVLPKASPDKPAVLMARGVVNGADDGITRRNPARIDLTQILDAGYSYVALGGLYAQIELRDDNGHAFAAYASSPQCLGWDSRGPSGCLTGTLSHDGTDIQFHNTAIYNWKTRHAELPPPYAESYAAKLAAAMRTINNDIFPNDLVKFSVSGALHDGQLAELERLVNEAKQQVLCIEANVDAIEFFSGLDPAELPRDSLFASFLQRCSVETAQSGSDQEVYDLVRRIGWLLFTGEGLPAEISE